MNWITAAIKELFSLFVDDVRFTIALLIWTGFAILILPRLIPASPWQGILFFAGIALILLGGCRAAAARK
ncbi:MAG: hypothetical protein EP348_01570 [Alphaproteobacteria bacterium]|nr:MAG: hypothetical protein EP348_01570 [Alphaproteobacteria bacterium]